MVSRPKLIESTNIIFRQSVLAGVCALFLSAPALAQTSVYSDIPNGEDSAAQCETLAASDPDEGGEWANVRCDGIAGLDIYIDYADARDTIRVGKEGKGTPFLAPFTSLGNKAEWRMADGKPYAMIVRLILGGIEDMEGQWLTVHHVDAATGQGCLVGYVDARANKNANVMARELADTAGREGCRKGEPIISGKMGKAIKELIAQEPQG